MGHKIRKYMSKIEDYRLLSNKVEVDETYIGGKSSGKRGRGTEGKSILFGMLEKGKSIIVKKVGGVKKKDLLPEIGSNIEKDATIQSGKLHSYSSLSKQGYSHETINHGEKKNSQGME